MEQHIGLGHGAQNVKVEVWWPATKTRQVFSKVGKDQFIEIKEFAADYTKLARHSFVVGGLKAASARK
jgi:hypothetical protein